MTDELRQALDTIAAAVRNASVTRVRTYDVAGLQLATYIAQGGGYVEAYTVASLQATLNEIGAPHGGPIGSRLRALAKERDQAYRERDEARKDTTTRTQRNATAPVHTHAEVDTVGRDCIGDVVVTIDLCCNTTPLQPGDSVSITKAGE